MRKNTTQQNENISRKSKTEIVIRLLKYLTPYKIKTIFVILLMLFVMVCNIINPYLLKVSIDTYVSTANIKGLISIGVFLLSLNFIAMFASRIRFIAMSSITNNILVNIRSEIYNHIQKLSFTFFDNRPVGKVLSRVIGDVNALQSLFSSSITNLIPELMNLLLVGIIIFFLNFKLALACIIFLPILTIAMFYIETNSRKRWQNYRQKRSNLNSYSHEDFSGIKVIQSFANEQYTTHNFKGMVQELVDSFIHAVKLQDFFWPLVELSWGIGTVVVFLVGYSSVRNGSLSLGTLIAFTMYIGMFWRPITNLANFYNSLITNLSAAERIFDILDIEPDIISLDNAKKIPKIKGSIEFKNVTFNYDLSSQPILSNVSFKVNAGETIALVGATGAGKTTIVSLLSRFYEVTKGEILIDGKNIKNVQLDSLRSQMGIMLQDTFLFSQSIKENIRYGKLDATDEEIIAACKAVNAHDFIVNMKNGYDTEVSERGCRLSLGQRQLISFARALLANPRILILDEATSNIDTHTEQLVQQGIKKLMHNRTSFIIAHRLSTIRDCDKILVVDDGKLYEHGTHDELLNKKGIYYNLYTAQYSFLNNGA